MKKTILILFFCSAIFAQKNEKTLINFDGIYETKCNFDDDEKDGDKSFLRFYPDGKVLSVGTECDATVSDLKDWFNMEMEFPSVGNYEIKGRKIRFSSTSKSGTVNYKGHVNKKGALKLRIKSLINGYRHTEEYNFTKIIQPK